MRRGSDPDKVRQRTKRFYRFERSRCSVGEFCEKESISAASFYRCRRIVAERGRGGAAPAAAGQTGQAAVTTKGKVTVQPSAPPLRPVELASEPESHVCLTVRLAGGMRLDVRSPVGVVETALTKVLEQAAAGREEVAC